MQLPIFVILFGIIIVIFPQKHLETFVRNLLKSFGIQIENKKLNTTKLFTELIKLTGAVLIAIGLILYFVLPYYDMAANF